jgi:hypothetical protein
MEGGYSVGVVVRPSRGQVRVTGQTAEMEIDPIHARCGAGSKSDPTQ